MKFHRIKSEKGMTLVEIIVALAILGLIILGIMGMYRLASSQIYTSGYRTDKILDARTIADDLIEQNEIQKLSSASQIDLYLSGKGYHGVSLLEDLDMKYDAFDVNYHIAAESLRATVAGYEVTILIFIDDNNSVQLTTFVIKGGGI